MSSFIVSNLSLKYVRFITSGCKDIEIRKLEFVAKTQFLCLIPIYFQPDGVPF